jgi:hypothetical protein
VVIVASPPPKKSKDRSKMLTKRTKRTVKNVVLAVALKDFAPKLH